MSSKINTKARSEPNLGSSTASLNEAKPDSLPGTLNRRDLHTRFSVASNEDDVLCSVKLLDNTEFEVAVDRKAKAQVLIDKVCDHVNIIEKEYFGLSFRDSDDLRWWLTNDKRIDRQIKNGPWVFTFEIKFYPPEPSLLQEDITRYQLCLQVRNDIVSGKLPCSFVTQALLGSFFVQSEVGDFDPEDHQFGYLQIFQFGPEQSQELELKVMELHKAQKGKSPSEADSLYLRNAKRLAMYGVDCHAALDSDGIDIMIGVCSHGISIYRNKLRISHFVWPKILKISFLETKFYLKIRPAQFEEYQNTVGFKLSNARAAKRLWKVAVEHHTFFRLKSTPKTYEKHTLKSFPKFGSRFRYSGRTQHQIRLTGFPSNRTAPNFTRTMSQRWSSRSMDELSHFSLDLNRTVDRTQDERLMKILEEMVMCPEEEPYSANKKRGRDRRPILETDIDSDLTENISLPLGSPTDKMLPQQNQPSAMAISDKNVKNKPISISQPNQLDSTSSWEENAYNSEDALNVCVSQEITGASYDINREVFMRSHSVDVLGTDNSGPSGKYSYSDNNFCRETEMDELLGKLEVDRFMQQQVATEPNLSVQGRMEPNATLRNGPKSESALDKTTLDNDILDDDVFQPSEDVNSDENLPQISEEMLEQVTEAISLHNHNQSKTNFSEIPSDLRDSKTSRRFPFFFSFRKPSGEKRIKSLKDKGLRSELKSVDEVDENKDEKEDKRKKKQFKKDKTTNSDKTTKIDKITNSDKTTDSDIELKDESIPKNRLNDDTQVKINNFPEDPNSKIEIIEIIETEGKELKELKEKKHTKDKNFITGEIISAKEIDSKKELKEKKKHMKDNASTEELAVDKEMDKKKKAKILKEDKKHEKEEKKKKIKLLKDEDDKQNKEKEEDSKDKLKEPNEKDLKKSKKKSKEKATKIEQDIIEDKNFNTPDQGGIAEHINAEDPSLQKSENKNIEIINKMQDNKKEKKSIFSSFMRGKKKENDSGKLDEKNKDKKMKKKDLKGIVLNNSNGSETENINTDEAGLNERSVDVLVNSRIDIPITVALNESAEVKNVVDNKVYLSDEICKSGDERHSKHNASESEASSITDIKMMEIIDKAQIHQPPSDSISDANISSNVALPGDNEKLNNLISINAKDKSSNKSQTQSVISYETDFNVANDSHNNLIGAKDKETDFLFPGNSLGILFQKAQDFHLQNNFQNCYDLQETDPNLIASQPNDSDELKFHKENYIANSKVIPETNLDFPNQGQNINSTNEHLVTPKVYYETDIDFPSQGHEPQPVTLKTYQETDIDDHENLQIGSQKILTLTDKHKELQAPVSKIINETDIDFPKGREVPQFSTFKKPNTPNGNTSQAHQKQSDLSSTFHETDIDFPKGYKEPESVSSKVFHETDIDFPNSHQGAFADISHEHQKQQPNLQESKMKFPGGFQKVPTVLSSLPQETSNDYLNKQQKHPFGLSKESEFFSSRQQNYPPLTLNEHHKNSTNLQNNYQQSYPLLTEIPYKTNINNTTNEAFKINLKHLEPGLPDWQIPTNTSKEKLNNDDVSKNCMVNTSSKLYTGTNLDLVDDNFNKTNLKERTINEERINNDGNISNIGEAVNNIGLASKTGIIPEDRKLESNGILGWTSNKTYSVTAGRTSNDNSWKAAGTSDDASRIAAVSSEIPKSKLLETSNVRHLDNKPDSPGVSPSPRRTDLQDARAKFFGQQTIVPSYYSTSVFNRPAPISAKPTTPNIKLDGASSPLTKSPSTNRSFATFGKPPLSENSSSNNPASSISTGPTNTIQEPKTDPLSRFNLGYSRFRHEKPKDDSNTSGKHLVVDTSAQEVIPKVIAADVIEVIPDKTIMFVDAQPASISPTATGKKGAILQDIVESKINPGGMKFSTPEKVELEDDSSESEADSEDSLEEYGSAENNKSDEMEQSFESDNQTSENVQQRQIVCETDPATGARIVTIKTIVLKPQKVDTYYETDEEILNNSYPSNDEENLMNQSFSNIDPSIYLGKTDNLIQGIVSGAPCTKTSAVEMIRLRSGSEMTENEIDENKEINLKNNYSKTRFEKISQNVTANPTSSAHQGIKRIIESKNPLIPEENQFEHNHGPEIDTIKKPSAVKVDVAKLPLVLNKTLDSKTNTTNQNSPSHIITDPIADQKSNDSEKPLLQSILESLKGEGNINVVDSVILKEETQEEKNSQNTKESKVEGKGYHQEISEQVKTTKKITYEKTRIEFSTSKDMKPLLFGGESSAFKPLKPPSQRSEDGNFTSFEKKVETVDDVSMTEPPQSRDMPQGPEKVLIVNMSDRYSSHNLDDSSEIQETDLDAHFDKKSKEMADPTKSRNTSTETRSEFSGRDSDTESVKSDNLKAKYMYRPFPANKVTNFGQETDIDKVYRPLVVKLPEDTSTSNSKTYEEPEVKYSFIEEYTPEKRLQQKSDETEMNITKKPEVPIYATIVKPSERSVVPEKNQDLDETLQSEKSVDQQYPAKKEKKSFFSFGSSKKKDKKEDKNKSYDSYVDDSLSFTISMAESINEMNTSKDSDKSAKKDKNKEKKSKIPKKSKDDGSITLSEEKLKVGKDKKEKLSKEEKKKQKIEESIRKVYEEEERKRRRRERRKQELDKSKSDSNLDINEKPTKPLQMDESRQKRSVPQTKDVERSNSPPVQTVSFSSLNRKLEQDEYIRAKEPGSPRDMSKYPFHHIELPEDEGKRVKRIYAPIPTPFGYGYKYSYRQMGLKDTGETMPLNDDEAIARSKASFFSAEDFEVNYISSNAVLDSARPSSEFPMQQEFDLDGGPIIDESKIMGQSTPISEIGSIKPIQTSSVYSSSMTLQSRSSSAASVETYASSKWSSKIPVFHTKAKFPSEQFNEQLQQPYEQSLQPNEKSQNNVKSSREPKSHYKESKLPRLSSGSEFDRALSACISDSTNLNPDMKVDKIQLPKKGKKK